MPTICRLIQLSAEDGTALRSDPSRFAATLEKKGYKSDVYRYWDAIQYLLARHSPASSGARWLTLGQEVAPATGGIPGARLVGADEVARLGTDLAAIDPDALAPFYDAAALDAAEVYPATWVEWEEDFDPLGQVLEHYSFLREFTARTGADGAWMLMHFTHLDEGEV